LIPFESFFSVDCKLLEIKVDFNHKIARNHGTNPKENRMALKYKHLYWIFTLGVALIFDQIFWEKPLGINFFIIILLALLAGLVPTWLEKICIPWTSYLLLIPSLFFAAMTFLRTEPLTNLINGALTLTAMILFVITLRHGRWYAFRIQDHLVNFIKFFFNTLVGGVLFLTKTTTSTPSAKEDPQDEGGVEAAGTRQKGAFFKKILPYARGLLLSLPILLILALLLASADPIFNDRLQNLFSAFRLDNLAETLFRAFYILIIAYGLLSAVYFGLVKSKGWDQASAGQPALKAFLGSIEAFIVLIGVNALFLVFVILQFNYLFGGRDNISVGGYTYAEYARRGFFELLAVAIISLVLFYVLSLVTKRETKAKRWIFSGLGLGLVTLVTIILASAYTRLQLYELAYGFTRLRTLAHIFMIWVGLFLAAVALLELTRRMERAAFILILFIVAFGMTINLLNMDRFIVQQNVQRAINPLQVDAQNALDTGYLFSLSYDAIPPLVGFFTDPDTPQRVQDDIGGVLACRLATLDRPENVPLTSYHHARSRAGNLLQSQAQNLAAYPVFEDQGWFVEVDGEVRSCYGYSTPFED
jgi:hypothetical protein